MKQSIKEYISSLLGHLDLSPTILEIFTVISHLLLIAILLWLVVLLLRASKTQILKPLTKKFRRTDWFDKLEQSGFFKTLFSLIPLMVGRELLPFAFEGIPTLIRLLNIIINIIGLWLMISTWNAFLAVLIQITRERRKGKSSSIGIISVLQLAKVLTYIMGALTTVSILLDLDLGAIFGYLGALTAVIILIFKDTILGFVAGLQISASRSVKTGDWIEVPKHKVDGLVTEITLVSTKIINWDNTIMTLPTYTLISETIKNWQGMIESGVRRVKRVIYMDVESIRLCSEEMIVAYKKNTPLEPASNMALSSEPTNLELFRNYMKYYLHKNRNISNNHIILVRPLAQSNPRGVPLEIYCFSILTEWQKYEEISAQVLEYALASSKLFGLRPFQEPSGIDFQQLKPVKKNDT